MTSPRTVPRPHRRVPGLHRVALVVALVVGPAIASLAAGYDGSLTAFRAHVAAHGRSWPLPERIDWFIAPDAVRIRYAHWTPPAGGPVRGVVVFFSGRTEFIEKNVATYQDLLRRGFHVWTLDWRGQGMSDRLIRDPAEHDKGHVAGFDDYVHDAEYFLDRIVAIRAASGAKVLLAHSMGAQIAVRYLLKHPDTFDRAVVTSPLLRVPRDSRSVRWSNTAKTLVGLSESCVLGTSPRWTSDFRVPACPLAVRGSVRAWDDVLQDAKASATYTHDWERLAERTCLIEESRSHVPNLGLACPTSAWLRAAFQSTDVTLAERHRLRTPTLIIPARDDGAVDNAGQVEFCDAQSPACCRAPEINGTGHELLVEREPIRARVFQLFDRFVASTTPAKTFCSALSQRGN